MFDPLDPHPAGVEQELGLRSAVESLRGSGHPVAALDVSGRVAVWNERAEVVLGWPAAGALGRAFFELLVGPSRLAWAEGLSALSAGVRWQGEVNMEGPRGRPVRVEVSADPVQSLGDRLGAVMVMRPLKQPELDRRLHELSTLLQVVPDAVIVVDADGLIREWNPAAEALFGSSRTLMLGSSFRQLVPSDRHDELEGVWARLSAGAAVMPYETQRMSSDGTRQHVTVHTAALRERGVFVGAVATFRKWSERQEGERLLSELVAEVPVVVAAYDADSRVTFAAGGGYLRSGITAWFGHGTRLLTAAPAGTGLHTAIERSLIGQVSQVRVLFDDRVWQCHVAPASEGGFLSAWDVTNEQVVSDRLQALLAAALLAFVTFDGTGRATFAAGAAFSAMSVESEDLVGLDLLELYRDTPDIHQALLRCLTGQRLDIVTEYGGLTWDLHFRSYRDANGSVTGGVCLAQNTTARQPDTAEPGGAGDPLRALAERVPPTGLIGRRGVLRRLDQPVADLEHRGVALIEIDDLALLTQQHGLDGTNVALQVLAGRVRTTCGKYFVGRWGNDGFVVVLDSAHADIELAELLARLTTALALPVALQSGTVHLSSTAAATSTVELPPDALLQHVQAEVVRARSRSGSSPGWLPVKGEGASLVASTRAQLMAGPADTVAWVARLRAALHDDELVLHYQPVVDGP